MVERTCDSRIEKVETGGLWVRGKLSLKMKTCYNTQITQAKMNNKETQTSFPS